MFCQGDTTQEQRWALDVPTEVRSVCSVLVCSFVDIGANLLIQEKVRQKEKGNQNYTVSA